MDNHFLFDLGNRLGDRLFDDLLDDLFDDDGLDLHYRFAFDDFFDDDGLNHLLGDSDGLLDNDGLDYLLAGDIDLFRDDDRLDDRFNYRLAATSDGSNGGYQQPGYRYRSQFN